MEVPQNGWFIVEKQSMNGWFGGATNLGKLHLYLQNLYMIFQLNHHYIPYIALSHESKMPIYLLIYIYDMYSYCPF